MLINYVYNKEKKSIELPNNTQIISPNEVIGKNVNEIIFDSLSNPHNSINLKDFLKLHKKILLIVNDGTRPTPTARVLEYIENDLKKNIVTIIVATGCHRGANDSEKHVILGSTYETFKNNFISHDARDESSLIFLGTSRNGTELKVNKAVVENDAILIIGSVEPHYFGGYTGGRKAIMPGISGYQSIEMNHKLALEPNAKALNLDTNPVHQDMIDTLNLLDDKPIFSIQAVMNKNHDIYKISSGNILDSFDAAIEDANSVFTVEVENKTDIVISVAKHPMDLDLYQSQKAIDNAKHVLKEKGIIILVSACLDGTGEKSFYDLLANSSSPTEVLNQIKKNYKLGYHKAGKMAEIMQNSSIYCVSELDKTVWSNIFIDKFDTLDLALAKAFELKGKEATVSFLSDGCVTVPRLKKSL